MMRTRWEGNNSPCYIVPEIRHEKTRTGGDCLSVFVFFVGEKHNILWPTKKTGHFSLFFSGELPLSPEETCAIMIVTDEFGAREL